MSNYVAPAFHPAVGRVREATWLDNYFGSHVYGVKFDDDPLVYRPVLCGIEAAGKEIEKLRRKIEHLEARKE